LMKLACTKNFSSCTIHRHVSGKLEYVKNGILIFMTLRNTHIKQLNKGKINFFYCLHVWVVLMLFLFSGADYAEAQEYATDRLFMKQYKKTKCRNEAEKMIRIIKKRPEMTLEHEVLLIQNIWVKLRSNLPLSPGERKLLKKLKEKGIVSKKMRSKEIWKHKATQFKDIRMKCKQIR